MLVRIIALLSVLFSTLICGISGGFQGYAWIWVLPLGFAGVFVLLVLLAFFVLWFLCSRVDLSVPQDGEDPFYRKVARIFAETALQLLRVHVHTTGLEQTPKNGRFLLVCNHLNDMDPVVLLHFFRDSQLAFISKRENTTMFIVGKMMHKLQCQLINRENDREALKTILNCIRILKEDKASIAVFPEGYTSMDGLLHKFRSGVFKIAQKANVPIVVCTVQNTAAIFPNAKHLKPTCVELHLLGVIPPEEVKSVSTVALAERIHSMMASDLGPEHVAAE